MKKILFLLTMFGFVVVAPLTALAVTPDIIGDSCDGVAVGESAICDSRNDDAGNFLSNLVSFLLWVVGILAVIMLIWGGIKYITSGGDSNKLTSAKNTILYSVIGLIVALFAAGIVAYINTNAETWSEKPSAPATSKPGGPSNQ